jgi:hypothetical protein
LAFMKEVGVAEIRVCVGDTGPGGAVAELRLRDGPKRIAGADGVLRWSAGRSKRSRHDKLRTYFKEIRVA